MTLIEVVAVVFGLVCVWMTIKQNIWCWPTGLAQVLIYIFIFLQAKLYSDMLLHVIYVVLQIYGWYYWLHGKGSDPLPVTRLRMQTFSMWISIAIVSTAGVGFVMSEYTDAALPYWDASIMAMSLIAQYLMAKKILESWLFWIVVDIIALGVYTAKGLYLTTGLYTVFFGLAITGMFTWKRTLAKPVLA